MSYLLYVMCVYQLYFNYNGRANNPLSVLDISYVEYKINFAHSILTVSSKERCEGEINGEYNQYYCPNIIMICALKVSVNMCIIDD